MTRKELENLGQNQIHQLLQKETHVDDLKEIWKRYGSDYPYYTDCTGALHRFD